MRARGRFVSVVCACGALLAGAHECEGRHGDGRASGVFAEEASAALERAAARLGRMAPATGPEVFPVRPGPLRPGTPSVVRVRGLPHPVFAVGADEASRTWLDANGARLREVGAQGVLVSAASAEVLQRMRARAARFGLTLDPMPGAALAAAFGVTSFPFVAEPSE